MKRASRNLLLFVAVVIAMCIGIGIVLASKRTPVKRFHVVYEGRVYRSGFPTAAGLAALMEKRPVKTVVSLSGDTTDEYKEFYAFTASSGVHHVSLPMGASRPPSREEAVAFLDALADSNNWPVLVHCGAGVERTGWMIALHRVVTEGWTWEHALKEACRYGLNDGKERQTVDAVAALARELSATNAPAWRNER
ncbi:dual specificity protein phosphatase family protein [bacterium]|nr:dual specificity protein phosphatase family protein [bacterium]